MTEPLRSDFFAATPVFQIDGEPRGELARDLVHAEVEESVAGLKVLRARFVGWGPRQGENEAGPLYLDGSLDFGQTVTTIMGAQDLVVFEGRISALEASFEEARPPEIVIFAEDRLMDLRMTRRLRTFEDSSDAEIAAEIAGEHGLQADVDADGPTYDVVQQWNQSDLAFLRERGRRIQAEVWVEGATLHFRTRPNRDATEVTLVQGNHLLTLEARADLAHQRTSVKVSGFDAQERGPIDEEAGNDALEAPGGRTGPQVLDRAFGDRVSYRVRDVPLEPQEATAWARAEMRRRGRGFVQVSGVTRGNPEMVVGSRLALERVGRPFEGGGYYVKRVRHTFDLSEGLRTRFEAERSTVEQGS